MNHIELGKEEVVVCGNEDIVIPMAQFMEFAKGIYDGYDVKGETVSMDVGSEVVCFFTNDGLTEVEVQIHHAMELAMHLL